MIKDIFRALLFANFILICCSDMNAQLVDTTHVKIKDGWIEKMGDKIAIDVSLNNTYETFEVKIEPKKYIFYPNTPTNLSLKLNYKFISVGFHFAPDFIPGNGDEVLKGKTKSFGIGTSLIFNHWFFYLKYSKVKGYYLENSADYSSWQKGDPYIQFPDLNYNGFTISSGYISNSKFSLKSLTSQTERQLKSVGSFIPVFNLRYYTMDDRSSDINTQKSNNLETSIGPGYTYTFVTNEKFYMSLGLQASFGLLSTKLATRQSDRTIITNQDNFIFRWDGNTGIGYNGSKFYSGLYANLSGTEYKQNNSTAMNFETRVSYHIFFGIRFKAPSYLERQATKIEKKII